MATLLPFTNAGLKNGKPWMWSQCVWPSRMFALMGCVAFAIKAEASGCAPVPQSITSSSPESVVISTHEVLPPKWIVPGPGVAIDPLVPQKRTRMAPSTRASRLHQLFCAKSLPECAQLLEDVRDTVGL